MKYKVGDKVRSKVSGFVGTIDDIRKGCCIVKTGNSKVTSWPEDLVPYEGLLEEETKPEPKFKGGNNDVKLIDEMCNIFASYLTDVFNTQSQIDKCVNYIKSNMLDDMIEGPVEEETTTNEPQFKPSDVSLEKEMEWNLPQGYQFKDENGNVINATKITLEKKKSYPKTYEECCKVLNNGQPIVIKEDFVLGYKGTLLHNFQILLICRDAYWKLYGEEMGLGKSWKPNGIYRKMYCISYDGSIVTYDMQGGHCVLAFPTEEIRDAFYENFKELIEQCKELL